MRLTHPRAMRRLNDRTSFRSNETPVVNDDGTVRIKHSDVNLDPQTRKAVARAEQGQPVGPIFDDAANTPAGRPAGRALAAGTRSPRQSQTQLVQRLAEIRDPHGGALGDSMSLEAMEDLGITGGVDHSVFAPRGSRPNVQGRSVATVRPQDHADAMRAWQAIKKGDVTAPNQQFASAEDMARALMSNIDQEGFNVTPVTPRQRRAATNLVEGFTGVDDVDAVVERAIQGPHTPASAGQLVRSQFPEAVSATKSAQRAVMQEQATATLARKLDEIFGHQGWGENYTPSVRPATSDMPSTVTGPRDGTSQIPDPGMTRLDPPGVAPKRDISADPPGTDLDPEIDAEDLAERASRLEGDGPELPGGEAEGTLRPGRAHGDKSRTQPSKAREEGGHKPGAYEDPDQSFAEFNRENVALSDTDAAKRQRFFDDWQRAVEMDPARSSDIRRQLRSLVEDPTPATADRLAQIEQLQRQLRLTQRLDEMSGVRSLQLADPDTGLLSRPMTNPTYPPPAVIRRPVDAEIEPSFDLTSRPHDEIIDAEFEVKRPPQDLPERVPPSPTARDADLPEETLPSTRVNRLKRVAAAAAAAAATGLGYWWGGGGGGGGVSAPPAGDAAPPIPGDGGGPPKPPPWDFGGEAMNYPAPEQSQPQPPVTTPEAADTIRRLRMQMRLNPNTQTLQSWTH